MAAVDRPIRTAVPAANNALVETDIRLLLAFWLRPPGGGQHPTRHGCGTLAYLDRDKNTPGHEKTKICPRARRGALAGQPGEGAPVRRRHTLAVDDAGSACLTATSKIKPD